MQDHRWKLHRLHRRREHHIADIQPTNTLWEISSATASPLLCLRRLQESLRHGLSCSFVGNYEKVQHQYQPYPSHQKLYDKATTAVLFNSTIGDWFWTKIGVRQGCLVSPTLFMIFLEKIITEALQEIMNIFSTTETSTMSSWTSRRHRQGLPYSFVGNYEEVQHQHRPYTSHQNSL